MSSSQTHHRSRYDEWLDELDDELVAAASGVVELMPRVARALRTNDSLVVAEARALADDAARRCREIDRSGFLLLARESPVAGDLRRLVSILRLVTAAERPAKLLEHAAETVERTDLRGLSPDVGQRVAELAERSAEVFGAGLEAWRRRDGGALRAVDGADEAADALAEGLLVRAGELDDPAAVVVLGLLARYYERIADHGVAFAQHATFAVTGQQVEIG